MPDGLPPEVVEMMARGMLDFVEEWDDAADADREEFRKMARRALASLPACVLVSDGQGNVTYRKELAEKPHGLGSGHDTTVTYDGQVQAFRYKADGK